MPNFLKIFLILCVCVLGGCERQEVYIRHANFGGHDLYIPSDYVVGVGSIGTEAALLQAWYPGAAIVPGRMENQIDRGEYWKSVRILINYLRLPQSFDEFSKKTESSYKATEFVAEEYGLTHMTQPAGGNKDTKDVWYEKKGDEVASRITCTERILKTDVPQCRHSFFMASDLVIDINYEKKLLPEWKTIKTNVESMIESFRSSETSKEFILQRRQEKQQISSQRN